MLISSAMTSRVVLDTDTFNEVDDQFALAHLLLSEAPLEAVHAAPFHNDRSTGPEDGMEKSHEEILRILDLVKPDRIPEVFKGSRSFLPAAQEAVDSEAARDLVRRASAGGPLTVLAIGAATNVASALLLEPRIAGNLTVVWLGGHAPYWPTAREFNLRQDLHAARVLLDSDVPLVLLPCEPVCSHLVTTVAELDALLAPSSALGAYLTDIVRSYGRGRPAWSKVIWDIAATAWYVNRDWIQTVRAPSPVLRDDATWAPGPQSGRKEIDLAVTVARDAIFADFFAKAAGR